MHGIAEVTLIQVLLMNCMGSTKKKKCEFSKIHWCQNWLPCLLRAGLFHAWGHRNKKRTFGVLSSIHLSWSLTWLVPRWLLSGTALVLSLSWVKQVFFSAYFVSSASAFPQMQAGSPQLLPSYYVTFFLLGVSKGKCTGFLFGHFRNTASRRWVAQLQCS